MPRKKTTAKPAAKKKPVKKAPGGKKGYSFDVLADEQSGLVEATRQGLEGIRAMRKNYPTGFKTVAQMQKRMIPYRHFAWKYLTSCYGLPEGCMLELIGAENLGKTTLMLWLMGGAMASGSPCYYQETENKILREAWARRILHPNPTIANKMLARLGAEKAFSLEVMAKNMEDWLSVCRGRTAKKGGFSVPIDTPLLVGVDTWSKLMPKTEALGFYDHGKNMTPEAKKNKQATGENSRPEGAKFAHAFGRRLPAMMDQENFCLVVASHQNDDFSMATGPAAKYAVSLGDLYNKKKPGGRALNQNAAMQIIMGRGPLVKRGDRKVGYTVKLRGAKNSYGADSRIIEMDVFTEGHEDTPELQSPAVSFDRWMCEFFVSEGILGTKVDSKRYSSAKLGVYNATPEEFSAVFHANEEALGAVCRAYNVFGYENAVDLAEGTVVPNEEEEPPPFDEGVEPGDGPEETEDETEEEEFIDPGE